MSRAGKAPGGAVWPRAPLQHRVCARRFLRSELLNMQYGHLYMPSTGALMLLTALHTCNQVKSPGAAFPRHLGGPLWVGVGHPEALTALCPPVPSQVSAYGFITANYEQFSDHYYEVEKKPLVFYANHDMLLEAELWRSLHQAGIMELYQR